MARASTNYLPASPLESRGRGDSRGDVACPERDPRFCTANGGTKRGHLRRANAQRRRQRVARASTNYLPASPLESRGERRQPRGRGMPGAGPAFCNANGGTKRGRLRRANAQRRRRSRPISRVLSWTVIRLGATSPQRSSNLPGSSAGHANGSLFGLAPGGVCRAGPLPDSRCALTAPFHPLPAPRKERRRYLSVALSVGLRRPGVTWHLALWSPDFPRHSCE